MRNVYIRYFYRKSVRINVWKSNNNQKKKHRNFNEKIILKYNLNQKFAGGNTKIILF